jgi:hypothetical protein
VRLWVNGQLVVDSWINQSPTERSGTIALTTGQKYDLKMEYFENSGGAVAKLLWSSASTTKAVIPQNQLFPPAAIAPTITTQPANQTVTVGQTASFSVVASGTAPLSYQWRKNGTNISGATSASYTTPATVMADNGALFSVVVSNSAGSVTSNNATLTVNAIAPSITTQPANATVTVGQTASFSVVASGTAPLSYQWRKNGTNISGATSSSYTTPATVSSDNGATFSVVVSNSAGSVTSNNATLTVNPLPTPTISLLASKTNPKVGETFTVTIKLDNTQPFANWQAYLSFDKAKLALVAQATGTFNTFIPDSRVLAEINGSGNIRSGGTGTTNNVGGNGTLGVFTFKAIGLGSATVTTENKSAANAFGNVLVNATGTSTLPQIAGSLTLTIGGHNPGDLNGDGVVNIDDLVLVTGHWGQTSSSPNWDARADANGDGVVNIDDLTEVTSNWGKTY